MAKRTKTTTPSPVDVRFLGYDRFFDEIAEVLERSRVASARTFNAIMTLTYWEIGRRLVEFEQHGKKRAGYGKALLKRLGTDLSARFGRGYSERNLRSMRAFYVNWPIRQTVSAESEHPGPDQVIAQIRQTPSATSTKAQELFPLPWSHYVMLLTVKKKAARTFYEAEAVRGGWSLRQLRRQINSQFYERTLLSRNKATMLSRGGKARPDDVVTPEEQIKDPFVLEFLDLKDEYSEAELEEALIYKLETFLLELGGDFTFIGRQRRLRIGDEWYRIDLLFFHRRLRCLVIIDLKLGNFTHADAGQMHMYLNYAREHWTLPDEHPPVGLILCASKDQTLAKYALQDLPNKVLASEYQMTLPDEKLLAQEIEQTRKFLETRDARKSRRSRKAKR